MSFNKESNKRPLSTPRKPPSKKGAYFSTPVKIKQKLKELQLLGSLNESFKIANYNSTSKTCGEASSLVDTVTVCDEERIHEQVKPIDVGTTNTTSTLPNLDVSASVHDFRNGSPLLEVELLLYALVNVSFPENAFNFKAKSAEKYDPIIQVIDRIYQVQFKNHDLRNYFHRAYHNLVKNFGKMKGILRRVFFKETISRTVEKFNPLLKSLLSDNVGTHNSIDEFKKFLEMECLQILNTDQSKNEDICKGDHDTSLEMSQNVFTVEEIPELHIFEHFPKWKANYSHDKKTCHLFFFSGNDGYAKVEVIINRSLTWLIAIEGKIKYTANLEWADVSNYITNVTELQKLMLVIESSKVCRGCPFEPFEGTIPKDINQPIFYTKSKEAAAYVETNLSQFHQKVIRSTGCVIFLPGADEVVCNSVCDLCMKTEHYLRTKKSRLNKKEDKENVSPQSSHLNFVYMNKEELLSVTRKQAAELRKLHKQVLQLEKYREKMSGVGEKTDNDLKFMFNNLNKCLISKREKLNNPVCQWEGCSSKEFSDVECLYSHVKEHIPETDSTIAPIDRVYTCLWKECQKKFSKKKLLLNHIRDHTGSAHDQFFEILLKDQAKSLTMPSKQMRWHPLVIKWCLRMYSKSHALYDDIRESGFIKLPSGRTLSDYKNFCSPQSGWSTGNIAAMKDKIEKLKLKKSARIGALIFDEVKIKEGLVFDPSTWELIGFTNLDTDDAIDYERPPNSQPEERLATHVLQFYFKSLFAKFEFPLSYFLTKSITAQKLNRVFWQGVSLLHGFDFTILLSICDGASENRAFIAMNGNNATKSQGCNPFSGRPIFFFSDPPHLIKKLRNNIFNSGFKENHTRYSRTLKLNNKYILWDHIYSVYEREKRRRLYATPLRRAHVQLDNWSKMRVKLAVNTLSKKVAEEMRAHENNATGSTQEYISICHDLWEVFDSRQPLASIHDNRITRLDNILSFFDNWKASLQQVFPTRSEVSSHFITWQTMFDLQVTINALKDLLQYINSAAFKDEFGNDLYLILKRLNQDCVESFFSVQRQMCGGSHNMTAYTYGYNLAGNISFTGSKLVSRKQTNVFEVEECMNVAANSGTLPKRQMGESIFSKIVWPVTLT